MIVLIVAVGMHDKDNSIQDRSTINDGKNHTIMVQIIPNLETFWRTCFERDSKSKWTKRCQDNWEIQIF